MGAVASTSIKADLTPGTFRALAALAEQHGMAPSTLVRRIAERVAAIGVPEGLPTDELYRTKQVRYRLTDSDVDALQAALAEWNEAHAIERQAKDPRTGKVTYGPSPARVNVSDVVQYLLNDAPAAERKRYLSSD